MNTETKCKAIAVAGQFVTGMAIGVVLDKKVYPECNTAEKVILWAGSTLLAWPIIMRSTKMFYGICDAKFGTDLERLID